MPDLSWAGTRYIKATRARTKSIHASDRLREVIAPFWPDNPSVHRLPAPQFDALPIWPDYVPLHLPTCQPSRSTHETSEHSRASKFSRVPYVAPRCTFDALWPKISWVYPVFGCRRLKNRCECSCSSSNDFDRKLTSPSRSPPLASIPNPPSSPPVCAPNKFWNNSSSTLAFDPRPLPRPLLSPPPASFPPWNSSPASIYFLLLLDFVPSGGSNMPNNSLSKLPPLDDNG